MKTQKTNDVLKEIRRIRKKHFEETKNMTMAERMEYYHRKSETFEKEYAAVKPDYDRFPFIHKREKTNDQNKTLEK
ncbi:MAG: hypothetical protein LBU34_15395 [Planctomycetaceae bacterium]|jgi:hypothetical protein|nr:hypothetical protein [Planctomycetaceae bacterium]